MRGYPCNALHAGDALSLAWASVSAQLRVRAPQPRRQIANLVFHTAFSLWQHDVFRATLWHEHLLYRRWVVQQATGTVTCLARCQLQKKGVSAASPLSPAIDATRLPIVV